VVFDSVCYGFSIKIQDNFLTEWYSHAGQYFPGLLFLFSQIFIFQQIYFPFLQRTYTTAANTRFTGVRNRITLNKKLLRNAQAVSIKRCVIVLTVHPKLKFNIFYQWKFLFLRINVFVIFLEKLKMNIPFQYSVIVACICKCLNHPAFPANQDFIHRIPNSTFLICIVQMKDLVDDQFQFMFVQPSLKQIIRGFILRKEVVNLKPVCMILRQCIQFVTKSNFVGPPVAVKKEKTRSRF